MALREIAPMIERLQHLVSSFEKRFGNTIELALPDTRCTYVLLSETQVSQAVADRLPQCQRKTESRTSFVA